jgi:hypothetical protein
VNNTPQASSPDQAVTDATLEVDDTEPDSTLKRRRQIAAASKVTRAKRKRELDDLRVENKTLRIDQTRHVEEITSLRKEVELLREASSADVELQLELLRAQLEEHQKFTSCLNKVSV